MACGLLVFGLRRRRHLSGSAIIVFMRRELARLLPNLAFLALLLGGQRLLSFNAPHDLAVSATVSVGVGLGGSVSFQSHRLSAARRAAVYAAGPAANLLAAPFCLLLPVPRWEAAYLALCVLASGLSDLVPGGADDGTTSDGSKLWPTPARLRADTEVRELLRNPG
jgi:hypothetical protein